jgi:hypothetical protein
MTLNPFHEWRPRLFRLLRVFAPDGSSLDAVFGSYSDWEKFKPKARVVPVEQAPKENDSAAAAKAK